MDIDNVDDVSWGLASDPEGDRQSVASDGLFGDIDALHPQFPPPPAPQPAPQPSPVPAFNVPPNNPIPGPPPPPQFPPLNAVINVTAQPVNCPLHLPAQRQIQFESAIRRLKYETNIRSQLPPNVGTGQRFQDNAHSRSYFLLNKLSRQGWNVLRLLPQQDQLKIKYTMALEDIYNTAQHHTEQVVINGGCIVYSTLRCKKWIGSLIAALLSPFDVPVFEEREMPERRAFWMDVSTGRIPHAGERAMAISRVYGVIV